MRGPHDDACGGRGGTGNRRARPARPWARRKRLAKRRRTPPGRCGGVRSGEASRPATQRVICRPRPVCSIPTTLSPCPCASYNRHKGTNPRMHFAISLSDVYRRREGPARWERSAPPRRRSHPALKHTPFQSSLSLLSDVPACSGTEPHDSGRRGPLTPPRGRPGLPPVRTKISIIILMEY